MTKQLFLLLLMVLCAFGLTRMAVADSSFDALLADYVRQDEQIEPTSAQGVALVAQSLFADLSDAVSIESGFLFDAAGSNELVADLAPLVHPDWAEEQD